MDTSQPSSNPDLEDCRDYARQMTDSIRNRGHTREHALRFVADYFGLKLRWTKSLIQGESVQMLEAQMADMRARFERHLDDEKAHLSARTAASGELRRRVEAGERIGYVRQPYVNLQRGRPRQKGTPPDGDDP